MYHNRKVYWWDIKTLVLLQGIVKFLVLDADYPIETTQFVISVVTKKT